MFGIILSHFVVMSEQLYQISSNMDTMVFNTFLSNFACKACKLCDHFNDIFVLHLSFSWDNLKINSNIPMIL